MSDRPANGIAVPWPPSGGLRGLLLARFGVRGGWQAVRVAWRHRQTRRAIANLDASALEDIGVSYAAAEAEANKPFWKS